MRLNKNIRQTLRIAKIELSSMFYSPVAWLILVIFALLIGYDYANVFDGQLHSQSLGNSLWNVSSAIYNFETDIEESLLVHSFDHDGTDESGISIGICKVVVFFAD